MTVIDVTSTHAILAGVRWRTVDLETGEARERSRGDAAARMVWQATDVRWTERGDEILAYDRRDLSTLARFADPEELGTDEPGTFLQVFGRGARCFVDLASDESAERLGPGLVMELRGREIVVVSRPSRHVVGFVQGWLDDDRMLVCDESSLLVVDAASGGAAKRIALPAHAMAAHALSPTAVLVQGPQHELWHVELATTAVSDVALQGGRPEPAIRILHPLDARRFVALWSGEGRMETLRVDELLVR